MYLDANNLYGWAMSQSLPIRDFKWVEEIDGFDVMTIPDDHPIGYYLEVDLEYPEELHDAHVDYPLAPERMKVTGDMLSPKQLEYLRTLQDRDDEDEIDVPKPPPKLVPNLRDKKKLRCSLSQFKVIILSLGMKLVKIHRILQFQQAPWLKSYIDFNTRQRAAATNDFEKKYLKLTNNLVFGKTMENLRNCRNINLVEDEFSAERYAVQPTFNSYRVFQDNLMAIER